MEEYSCRDPRIDIVIISPITCPVVGSVTPITHSIESLIDQSNSIKV